jgi:hypothetical protein
MHQPFKTLGQSRVNMRLVGCSLILALFTTLLAPHSTHATLLNQTPNRCLEIYARAVASLKAYCTGVSRNEACYGNRNVRADLRDAALVFETAGDLVPVEGLAGLATAALNPERDVWGVAVLKLRANLPNTLPGQNVTFLVYGDTSLQSAAKEMQAFYFSTGLGETQCQEVPQDGILIRSPKRTTVTFSVNGVQVSLGSTALLAAAPNGTMSFGLIEGQSTLTAQGVSRALQPNQQVLFRLGGANGLEALSAPSQPIAWTPDPRLTPLLDALDDLEAVRTVPTLVPRRATAVPGSTGGSGSSGGDDGGTGGDDGGGTGGDDGGDGGGDDGGDDGGGDDGGGGDD